MKTIKLYALTIAMRVVESLCGYANHLASALDRLADRVDTALWDLKHGDYPTGN